MGLNRVNSMEGSGMENATTTGLINWANSLKGQRWAEIEFNLKPA